MAMIALPLHLRRLPTKWQWSEVCAGTLVLLVLSHIWVPEDPYLTQSPFPWIWLAPVLMALRYGLWGGLLSSSLILGGVLMEKGMGERIGVSKAYLIGELFLVLICGEFGSRWNLYGKQLGERLRYLSERLHDTTVAYHLLGMSHQHLEASLASRPLTLRVALARLRGMLVKESSSGSIPPAIAQRFLQLLAQYFQLECASLYGARADGSILPHPIATIGNPGPLVEDDPLVRYAQASQDRVHVMSDGAASDTRYVVVAPATTSDEHIVGWLAVEQIRFLNLHHESLHMLNVFLSYFADGVHLAPLVEPILHRFPDCPLPFAQELPRLIRLQHEWHQQSRLVVFVLRDGPSQDEFAQVLCHNIRGLDLAWDVQRPNSRVVCILLPFSDDAAVEGFLARMRQLFTERFGRTFDELGIHCMIKSLAGADAVSVLEDAFPCSHDDHHLLVPSHTH
ncbi:MAG: hypothetical protein D6690_01985 [Nitrospirae bacterium]|nr:MAG: hypothetical protein D6690_01985 [Nitrospirota bacterium]